MTLSDAIRYVSGKLVKVYPIYLCTFLMAALLEHNVSCNNGINAILSICMLQSWSNSSEVFFSFNGVSWFAASLMYAYLVGCLFIGALNNSRKAVLALVFCAVSRYLLEYLNVQYNDAYFALNMHVNPIIRSLEFGCGMAVAVIGNIVKEKMERIPKYVFTLLEMMSLGVTVFLAIKMNGYWMRAMYIYLFCVVIFIFSFDKGALSSFVSKKPFMWFGSIQLEFYLIHQVVCKAIQPLVTWSWKNWYLETASICFVSTICCVYIYRCLLKKNMEKWMLCFATKIGALLNT